MSSLWGINGSPSTSTDYPEQWRHVDTRPNPCTQRQAAMVDAGPSRMSAFRKQYSPNQFKELWRNIGSRQSAFTGQRSSSKRHYELPDEGEPRMKRLLSERMAVGMRKLRISEDADYGKSSLGHNVSSSRLWEDGRVFGAGINHANDSWKQEIDDRLDVKFDSDESGCEDDQPQLIIKQDFLDVLKSQNVQPSLPPQIITNIRESSMQLVLWKPVPFLGICDDKTNEEEDSTTSAKKADSNQNIADDNMADSPVDEDMDL